MGKLIFVVAVILFVGLAIYIYKFKGYKGEEKQEGPVRNFGSKSGLTADEIDSHNGEKNQ